MKDTYALYSVTEVESFLLANPKGFDFKQGHELLCGCIISKHMMTGDEKNVGIGFRLSDSQEIRSSDRPSLSKLLSEFKLDDRDIDVVVGTDLWLSPIQVTRLVGTGQGASSEDRLKAIIQKKINVQPDSKLLLAVMIDETFSLKYNEFVEFINDLTIPYGGIYLIGKTEVDPYLGEFNCIEIYPKHTISPIVSIFKQK